MIYRNFSKDFQKQLAADLAANHQHPLRTTEAQALRRNMDRDMSARLHRPAFGRDIEKILNLPAYNRYARKTQVFSFVRNDDISTRGLHVQLVARTAVNISRLLGLNTDLTQAIALGHDLGHTPFGHAGERYLSAIYHAHTGRYFNHNVHSARVLDALYRRNVCLQTLDGVICHNGESSQREFLLGTTHDFAAFDRMMEECYVDEKAIKRLRPSTLEGCVVRISDMIAYVGKDRQDAMSTRSIARDQEFADLGLGTTNAELVNNLTVDIVENSYDGDCIRMSENAFAALKTAKSENYERIYLSDDQAKVYDDELQPMFAELYEALLADLLAGNESSPIFAHHIAHIQRAHGTYGQDGAADYRSTEPNDLVTDCIASMTDEYFIACHQLLCPDSPHTVTFRGYFDDLDYRPASR